MLGGLPRNAETMIAIPSTPTSTSAITMPEMMSTTLRVFDILLALVVPVSGCVLGSGLEFMLFTYCFLLDFAGCEYEDGEAKVYKRQKAEGSQQKAVGS